jgi:hypothetical protein
MIINIIVSEILGIVLSLLSSAYFYLTELLLILIILPIIILIVTFSPSLPNKTKILLLIFNIIYSLLLPQIISKLLLVIKLLIIIIFLYYKIILNNMYMVSYFLIFTLIFAKIAEIYLKIVTLSLMIIVREGIYSIIAILSFIIVLYVFIKETSNFKKYKEYINNNKLFFIVAFVISLISGFILFFFILPTHSRSYVDRFFFIILLIAFILSYVLSFNQKNMIKILSELSEHAIDMITLWSYILLLSFSEVGKSITDIFRLYSPSYQLVTFIIIVITIFFLMFIMSLYVYAVNKDRNLENKVKWIILAGFSISLLTVYIFGNRSIWYIIIGILIFIILIYMYLYIYSCILKNINNKNWNDILGIILAVYIISFTILYPIVEVLYLAIIYVFLTVISLFIYCHRINKEKGCNKQ